MRIEPNRIAARIRIERKWNDERGENLHNFSRNRRQLIGGTPKEETIQVTAPLFSSRLFEYGPKTGDKELSGGLDMSKRMHLSRPITFFGHSYSTIWVLSNGGIGFDHGIKQYRPNMLPSVGQKLIAPFWNRNDLRNKGKVFFREVNGGRVLERGQSEIRYQYDREVKVLSAVVVTYEKMQPVGSNSLPDEAGFNAGDGSNHFALPSSGTGNIMYLEEYGNTGIPGEWMFVLDEERVVRCKAGIKGDTCDEACSAGEWGADCVQCCHCAEGSCHEVSGECKSGGCARCWRGRDCQQRDSACDTPRQCGQNAQQKLTGNALLSRCGEPPRAQCECLAGYEGTPEGEGCSDINECAQKNSCHEKATCTNTPGRFFCQCPDGYSGNGITECVLSFLHPFEQSHRLPKDRNGHIEWQLKHSLKVFGRDRDSVVITTNGLILVQGAKQLNSISSGEQPRLDELDVYGVAPFFASIGLAQQGQIFVEETTDPSLLTKVSRTVNEQLTESRHSPFVGSHALMVTYVNVSLANADSKLSNTFQTLLIGGRDKQKRENMTFVQFLYRDIAWSEGAEAGIMAPDKSSSILLPGSGTVGIEQLSQLSNVHSQGIWLYRIDLPALMPCMQPDLQPPYCDARSPTLHHQSQEQSQQQPQQLPNQQQQQQQQKQQQKSHQPVQRHSNFLEMKMMTAERQHQPHQQEGHGQKEPPQFVHVEQTGWQPLVEEERKEPPPTEERGRGEERGESAPKQTAQTLPEGKKTGNASGHNILEPTFSISSRKPAIVTIQSKEIEEMPPDAFDDGIVRTTTTPRGKLVIEEEQEGIAGGIVPELIVPELVIGRKGGGRADEELKANPQTELHIEPITATARTSTAKPFGTLPREEEEQSEDSKQSAVPSPPPQRQRPTTPEAKTSRVSVLTTEIATTKTVTSSSPSTTEPNRVFIFSTNSTNRPILSSSTKRTKATTAAPKVKANNPDGDDPVLMDFDNNNNNLLAESGVHGNKLSVVVPVAIVLIWLVVLVIVAVFLCCRRRQTQERLRTLYGPAYQIRPVYTMRVNKLGSGNGSYEEHLDKAAHRLSAEMAYNPGSAAARANGTKTILNGGGPQQQQHAPRTQMAPLEISSPRGSNGSGGGGTSAFGSYIQSLAKMGASAGAGGTDRDDAQSECFASSQRSTTRFSSTNNGGGRL
uniref:EGF-like domain-containing protein n=1 Tax=Globodera pallida TaxID=36090 RepID=A0A183CAB2_GLOPA